MTNAARALDALGDPTRRSVFERLRHRTRSVAQIAEGMPVTRPAVSQHLKVLKAAGLVVVRREGTRNLDAVNPKGCESLWRWLDGFWDEALIAFQTLTTERKMSDSIDFANTDPNSVRKLVRVEAPREVAWRVFTEKMGTWWPLAHYKIGKSDAVDAIIEPRVGGRWYERGKDGSTCDWGRVLVWEPHSRSRRDEMRRVFDKEGDWGRLLASFAARAAEGA